MNVELDVSGELSPVAGRAEIIRAFNPCPADHREDPPGTDPFVPGRVTTTTRNRLVVV